MPFEFFFGTKKQFKPTRAIHKFFYFFSHNLPPPYFSQFTYFEPYPPHFFDTTPHINVSLRLFACIISCKVVLLCTNVIVPLKVITSLTALYGLFVTCHHIATNSNGHNQRMTHEYKPYVSSCVCVLPNE